MFKSEKISASNSTSNKQRLFLRFTYAVLVDLTILNLFSQYWDLVSINKFSVSLLAAILLQSLLQLAILVESKAAGYFSSQKGMKPILKRAFATWGILVVSKLVMLGVINLAFKGDLTFSGPLGGLIAFLIVILAIVVSEQTIRRVYILLA